MDNLTGDEATGVKIVREALSAPLKQIAHNAGLEPGVVADKVASLPAGQGLNAATGEYVDLMQACDDSIPDPERELDKPFLMPIEDIFTITGR